MEVVLDKDQRVGESRVEAEDGKLNYEDSSDDEEVKLLLHRKGADERDPPGRISEMCRRRRVLSGMVYDGASQWGSAEVEPGGATSTGT